MRLPTALRGALAMLALCPAIALGQSAKAAKSAADTARKPAATASRPPAATAVVSATCNDGTLFSGTSRQGACSNHGGVKDWISRGEPTPPKGATARCADGSFSMSPERKGACSGHGGVKDWLRK
jgi:Protein of unknown function (DUF3761)